MADKMQEQEHDSFLDLDLSSVPEMTNAAEDEYRIQIARVQPGVSRKGEKYVMLFFDIPSEPTVRTFSQYYGLGTAEDTDKEKLEKLNRFKEALDAFGYTNLSQVRYEELIGLETWAIVGETEARDDYPASNRIVRFLGER